MYCKSIRGLLYLCVGEEQYISTSRDTIEMIGGDGSLVGGMEEIDGEGEEDVFVYLPFITDSLLRTLTN